MTTPTEKNEVNNKYKDFKKLRRHQEVQTWLRTIGESSVSVYINALKKFCDFSGISPHELILMRDEPEFQIKVCFPPVEV